MSRPALVQPTAAEIADVLGKAPTPPRVMQAPGVAASGNSVDFRYNSHEEAFPNIDCGIEPFGSMVLVQIRQPKMRSAGGIILTTEDRVAEHYATQIAKVIALGSLAFKDRNTGKLWPEGSWAQPGDFVRVPKYQGDRIPVPFTHPDFVIEDGVRHEAICKDEAVFVLFKDLALLGRYTGDPLTVRAWL